MALFDNRNDGFDMEREMAALRREVATLGNQVSRRSKAAYRGASDDIGNLYDDLASSLSAALPVLRKRARGFEETIRDNPGRTAAVVGLAALTVAAAVLIGSRRR
jgi:hypothetical protein